MGVCVEGGVGGGRPERFPVSLCAITISPFFKPLLNLVWIEGFGVWGVTLGDFGGLGGFLGLL